MKSIPEVAALQARLSDRTARVGVLMGGRSTERKVSLKSGKAVAEALVRRGWDTVAIDVGPDLPFRLRDERIDVAWIALHGAFGEDGCVQGTLEVMRVPYTGSGVQASAIAMDKVATKRRLADRGVRLPADTAWHAGDPMPQLALPLICKTPRGGSTLGILRAPDAAALEGALAELSKLDDTVLVEQVITGDEITVAVLDGRPLPVTLIRPIGDDFFDFEAKYTEGRTEYITPAPIDDATRIDAQRQAKVAYDALALRGVARADFIVDEAGHAWFLEINTIPGMTATSLSPMAAAAVGIDFDGLVEGVLLAASLGVAEASADEQGAPGA